MSEEERRLTKFLVTVLIVKIAVVALLGIAALVLFATGNL